MEEKAVKKLTPKEMCRFEFFFGLQTQSGQIGWSSSRHKNERSGNCKEQNLL